MKCSFSLGSPRYAHRTGSTRAADVAGTAQIITHATLIIVSVFTAFVFSTNVTVKMLAVGLVLGVLIDATVVSLLLVRR